jgi:hypothetical protein
MPHTQDSAGSMKLGLGENVGQFSLLVLINVFVGMMVGLERTVVPLIGEKEFGLVSKTAIMSFIVSFGVTKGRRQSIFGAYVGKDWEERGPYHWLAHRPPGAVHHHLRKSLVLVRRRQRLAWD